MIQKPSDSNKYVCLDELTKIILEVPSLIFNCYFSVWSFSLDPTLQRRIIELIVNNGFVGMSKEDVVWPNLKHYIRTNGKYWENWLENFSQVN